MFYDEIFLVFFEGVEGTAPGDSSFYVTG